MTPFTLSFKVLLILLIRLGRCLPSVSAGRVVCLHESLLNATYKQILKCNLPMQFMIISCSCILPLQKIFGIPTFQHSHRSSYDTSKDPAELLVINRSQAVKYDEASQMGSDMCSSDHHTLTARLLPMFCVFISQTSDINEALLTCTTS